MLRGEAVGWRGGVAVLVGDGYFGVLDVGGAVGKLGANWDGEPGTIADVAGLDGDGTGGLLDAHVPLLNFVAVEVELRTLRELAGRRDGDALLRLDERIFVFDRGGVGVVVSAGNDGDLGVIGGRGFVCKEDEDTVAQSLAGAQLRCGLDGNGTGLFVGGQLPAVNVGRADGLGALWERDARLDDDGATCGDFGVGPFARFLCLRRRIRCRSRFRRSGLFRAQLRRGQTGADQRCGGCQYSGVLCSVHCSST